MVLRLLVVDNFLVWYWGLNGWVHILLCQPDLSGLSALGLLEVPKVAKSGAWGIFTMSPPCSKIFLIARQNRTCFRGRGVDACG
jgi:hypothetical protein